MGLEEKPRSTRVEEVPGHRGGHERLLYGIAKRGGPMGSRPEVKRLSKQEVFECEAEARVTELGQREKIRPENCLGVWVAKSRIGAE